MGFSMQGYRGPSSHTRQLSNILHGALAFSLCVWHMPCTAVNFKRHGDANSPRKKKRNISKLIFWRKEPTSPRVGLYVSGRDRKETRVQFVVPREMEEMWT